MLRSIGKQSWESVESVLTKKRKATGEGFAEKKVLSQDWNSEGMMDGGSQSMEPTEEAPLIGLGDSELERLVRGWRREAGSWSQRQGKAYWK